jgi:hypothetical protein
MNYIFTYIYFCTFNGVNCLYISSTSYLNSLQNHCELCLANPLSYFVSDAGSIRIHQSGLVSISPEIGVLFFCRNYYSLGSRSKIMLTFYDCTNQRSPLPFIKEIIILYRYVSGLTDSTNDYTKRVYGLFKLKDIYKSLVKVWPTMW